MKNLSQNEPFSENRRQRYRIWRAANPDYYKKYRVDNSEKIKERHRIWRAANPEKVKELRRKYRAANRVKCSDWNKLRFVLGVCAAVGCGGKTLGTDFCRKCLAKKGL